MAKNERLEIKKARLKLYLKAEIAILSGQSYEIEGLKLTRANLKEVQSMISRLEADVSRMSGKQRPRTRFIVPRDEF
ncbi:MAG: DUF6148 family protein [Synergistaceae bacterium]|jgi:hypothetical protein|nr:DUF6148 family protein [Synergistaceae bacterium]